MESLLYEIRKDVFIQARDIEFGERFFNLIDWLCEMSETAKKEGLLALEEAVAKIPPEIALHKEIQWIAFLVTVGTDPDEIMEIVTAHYWMNHFQGEDALLYYMIARAFQKIQAGKETELIRILLVKYLPQDAEEQYKDYQSRKLAPISAVRKEKLFYDAPVLEEQWTLRTLLEEKILQAEDRMIQRVLRDINSTDCITALKGLSPTARQKILSNLSKRLVDMFAEDWEYLGSVSRHNLIGALGSMLCIFEDVEKKLAEKQIHV